MCFQYVIQAISQKQKDRPVTRGICPFNTYVDFQYCTLFYWYLLSSKFMTIRGSGEQAAAEFYCGFRLLRGKRSSCLSINRPGRCLNDIMVYIKREYNPHSWSIRLLFLREERIADAFCSASIILASMLHIFIILGETTEID